LAQEFEVLERSIDTNNGIRLSRGQDDLYGR